MITVNINELNNWKMYNRIKQWEYIQENSSLSDFKEEKEIILLYKLE